MHLEIKQELFNELPIDGKFNFKYEYERAYNQVVGYNPIISKDVAKEAIQAILIEKLDQNAQAPHETRIGKILAVLSKVGAVILKFIKL